jgi:beta-glucosidase
MPFVLFVFSDKFSRFGTYSVDHAINAGLDLEMPGLNKWRTFEKVERSVVARKVAVRTIKERAKKVLELVQKCAREAPEVRDDNPLMTGLVINLCL